MNLETSTFVIILQIEAKQIFQRRFNFSNRILQRFPAEGCTRNILLELRSGRVCGF